MLSGRTIITTDASLLEIKRMVRDETIDKFVEKLKSGYEEIIANNDCSIDCKPCLNEFLKEIDEFAEQMKGDK